MLVYITIQYKPKNDSFCHFLDEHEKNKVNFGGEICRLWYMPWAIMFSITSIFSLKYLFSDEIEFFMEATGRIATSYFGMSGLEKIKFFQNLVLINQRLYKLKSRKEFFVLSNDCLQIWFIKCSFDNLVLILLFRIFCLKFLII